MVDLVDKQRLVEATECLKGGAEGEDSVGSNTVAMYVAIATTPRQRPRSASVKQA